MSILGDGGEDMFSHRDLDAALVDAVLRDEVTAPGDTAFAAFLVDVLFVAETPAPAPSAALAEILAGAAPIPVTTESQSPSGRARRLLGRVAGIGVAAKFSLAAVAAGAAITTAGLTHSLPGSTQRMFEDVVNHATPWTITHEHATPPSEPPTPNPATSQQPHPPGVPSSLVPTLPLLPSQASSPPAQSGVPSTLPVPSQRPSSPPRPTPSSGRTTPPRPAPSSGRTTPPRAAPSSTSHPTPPVTPGVRPSPAPHR